MTRTAAEMRKALTALKIAIGESRYAKLPEAEAALAPLLGVLCWCLGHPNGAPFDALVRSYLHTYRHEIAQLTRDPARN